MLHFILFLLLVVLWLLIARLAKKNSENVVFRYFRNFIFIWSICTIVTGIAEEIFLEKSPMMFIVFALVLPFLYLASYYLVRIPFALNKKENSLARFLSALVVVLGVFYGLSLFLIVQNWQPKAGPLAGFFTFLSDNFSTPIITSNQPDIHSESAESEVSETIAPRSESRFERPRVIVFHMITMLLIFIPVGLFFLLEAIKAGGFRNRIRLGLIGLGILGIGIAEWSHVPGLDSANRDLFLIFGFVLVVAGLFYRERSIKASV